MDLDDFNHTARILGRKHVPAVLRKISHKETIKASDLASYVGITVATAVSYLNDLESIGILEKEHVQGETGEIWIYCIANKEITLTTEIE